MLLNSELKIFGHISPLLPFQAQTYPSPPQPQGSQHHGSEFNIPQQSTNKHPPQGSMQLAIVPTNRIKPNSHIQQRFINWGLVHVPWARRDMVGMPQACQDLVGARWNCRGLVGARRSYPRFGAYATKLLRFGACAMSSLDSGCYVTGR